MSLPQRKVYTSSKLTGTSFKGQIHEYRAKQTETFRKSIKTATLIDDSMIKHIRGDKLSQTKSVSVMSHPGDKIEDLTRMLRNGSIHLQTSELIVHVGTNNTNDDAKTIIRKLESLCETAQEKYSISDITISSIIHRSKENQQQCDKITTTNKLIKETCSVHKWTFINNDNINRRFLEVDGIHLSRVGITRFARNFIRHLRGQPPVNSTYVNHRKANSEHAHWNSSTFQSNGSLVSRGNNGLPPTYAEITIITMLK